MFKKIKNFFAEKYKVLIPVMVVIVLLVAVFFLYREYKFDNYRDKREVSVFQHFAGVKVEYDAIVTYDLQKKIRDITPKDKVITYDSTPIYYKDKKEVIFPEEMIVAFPLTNGKQYRVYKYGSCSKEDNIIKIKNLNNEGIYEDFFMYDGKELFFFPTNVNLMFDGKLYMKLSEGSYVDVVGDSMLIYYDQKTDESKIINLDGKKASIESKYINIDLMNKNFTSFGKKIILYSNLNLLDTLYKTD